MAKRWTVKETEYLINIHDAMTYKEIALRLGRTYDAVRNRSVMLGLMAPANWVVWTEAELEYLDRNYGLMLAKDIAAKLGRTLEAVRAQAKQRKLQNAPSTWTPENKKLLLSLWGNRPLAEIAKIIGVSEDSIAGQRKHLGLGPMTTESRYFNLNQVSRILGVSVGVIQHWREKYGLKMRRLSCYTVISPQALSAWLKNNQSKWDSRILGVGVLGSEPGWLKEKRLADIGKPTMRRVPRNWTTKEVARLMQLYYASHKAKEIAEMLGRSPGAVEHKISRMRMAEKLRGGNPNEAIDLS